MIWAHSCPFDSRCNFFLVLESQDLSTVPMIIEVVSSTVHQLWRRVSHLYLRLMNFTDRQFRWFVYNALTAFAWKFASFINGIEAQLVCYLYVLFVLDIPARPPPNGSRICSAICIFTLDPLFFHEYVNAANCVIWFRVLALVIWNQVIRSCSKSTEFHWNLAIKQFLCKLKLLYFLLVVLDYMLYNFTPMSSIMCLRLFLVKVATYLRRVGTFCKFRCFTRISLFYFANSLKRLLSPFTHILIEKWSHSGTPSSHIWILKRYQLKLPTSDTHMNSQNFPDGK